MSSGTSDEHISLLTHLHPLFTPTASRPTTPSSVLITTPQTTALNDTIKSLSFTRKLALPVIGLVENMAGYACPCCGEISDTFGRGGGEDMARRNGVGFLGRVPIDTVLVGLLDAASKGEIPAAGLNGAIGNDSSGPPKPNGDLHDNPEASGFPLLERYLETASARVWKEITQRVVDGIDTRRSDTLQHLERLTVSTDTA